MIDTLSELYGLFISLLAISLAIGCTIIWIMLIINNRQQETFDEKYRRTRKHEGYKTRR
jgi:hypothetical protein